MTKSNQIQTVSNREIYALALQEWLSILTKLWTAFGKEVNKDQLKVYKESLGDLPLGILENVVEETIKRHRYNSVPTLAEIQDVLNELQRDGASHIHSRPNRKERIRQRLDAGQPEYEIVNNQVVEFAL